MNERTNAELIQAIRDEDRKFGESYMLIVRIIHNVTVTMQTAWLEWRFRGRNGTAMLDIENLLEDTDNIPEGDFTQDGSISRFYSENHLDGEISPYTSRLTPFLEELERRVEFLQKGLDEARVERDRLADELKQAREQEPVAPVVQFTDDDLNEIHELAHELGGTESGEYLLDGDNLDQVIVKAASLFYKPAAPVVPDATCKPSLQVPQEWRDVLIGLIAIAEKKGKRQGSPNHCHAIPGIWDSDNGVLAGKPCAECAMYDRARAMVQSASQPAKEFRTSTKGSGV